MAKFLALSLVALLAVACAAVQPATTPTPTPSPAPATPSPTLPVDEVDMQPDARLEAIEAAAVADLAERLGVEPTAIEIVDSQPVTWPDASLGCPRSGEAYAQVEVDGHRLILGYGGRVYLYHAASEGPPILCPSDERDGGYEFVPPPGIDT